MKQRKDQNRINREIRATEVRIVGENAGVYDINEAILIAENKGADLVEVSQANDMPICKIIAYDKFLYEKKKKQKEQDKKQKEAKQEVKELRFGPNIDEHDFNFKSSHARNFLVKKDKVKAVVFFSGREINYSSKGEIILLKLAEELSDVGTVESMPILEGKRMIMTIKLKK